MQLGSALSVGEEEEVWPHQAHEDDGPPLPLYLPPTKKGNGRGKGANTFSTAGRGSAEGQAGPWLARARARARARASTSHRGLLCWEVVDRLRVLWCHSVPVMVAPTSVSAVAEIPGEEVPQLWTASARPSVAFGEDPVHVSARALCAIRPRIFSAPRLWWTRVGLSRGLRLGILSSPDRAMLMHKRKIEKDPSAT